MNLFANKKPIGVLCCDGLNWTAVLFRFENGTWIAGEMLHESGNGDRMIPPALVVHLAVASRIRVLVPSELRMVSLHLPEDLHREEIQSALANNLFDEFEDAAAPARFTVARADLYSMCHDDSVLLVSRFELRRITRLENDLGAAELTLEAVGALESALLDWHARTHPAARLLFVGRQAGLYAVPEDDSAAFLLTGLPLGLEVPTEATRERLERVVARIAARSDCPLYVVFMDRVGEAQRRWLEQKLDSVAGWHDFSEMCDAVLLRAAQSPVGETEAPLAMITPPPAPKDPHRSGTLLFVAIVLMTGWLLGYQWSELHAELKTGQTRKEDWKTLQTARAAAQTQLKRLAEKQVQLQHKLQRLSPDQTRLPVGLMPILETLGQESTTYSRISSIAQWPDGSFDIRGITLWQTEVTRINAALRQTAEREKLTHEMKEMSGSDARVQCFEFTVQPQGGRS
jgi:hypothetical protein